MALAPTDKPKRLLAVVVRWERFLSKSSQDALSYHDRMELVRLLEERLTEVVEPLKFLAGVKSYPNGESDVLGRVSLVLEEAEACMRTAPPRRLPE
jgi:hypothetical protein